MERAGISEGIDGKFLLWIATRAQGVSISHKGFVGEIARIRKLLWGCS